MKKILILIVLGAALVACSGDTNEVPTPVAEPQAGPCIDGADVDRSVSLMTEFVGLMEQGEAAATAGDIDGAIAATDDAGYLMDEMATLWIDNDATMSSLAGQVATEMHSAARALEVTDFETATTAILSGTALLDQLTARTDEITSELDAGTVEPC